MPKLIKPCRFGWDPAWAPRLHSCDPYIGCPFDCSYCWSKAMAHRFKREPPGGWRNVQLQGVLYSLASYAFTLAQGKAKSILLSATCDPYPPLEKRLNITKEMLEAILWANRGRLEQHRVFILTKSPIVCRDWELLKALDAQVGFTLTAPAGVDTRAWEPYAPSNASRIAALKILHGKGIKTFVSCEPWLVAFCDFGSSRTAPQEWQDEGWPSFGNYRDYTQPWRIVEETWPWVDYFLVGSWNRAGKPYKALTPYYKEALPKVIEALERYKPGAYWVKPELRGVTNAL